MFANAQNSTCEKGQWEMQKTESRLLSLQFSDLTTCSSTTFRPLEDVVAEVVQKESELISREQQKNSCVRVKPFLPKVRKGDLHITAAWAEERKKHKKLEKRQNTLSTKGKDSLEAINKLSQDISAGICQIFTRSIGRRVTIEKMWNELKADEQKRLQPVILHAEKLRSSASPSAKQCLEIYSKPTSIDRYTGKPVPLGQMLNAVRRKHSRSTMSIINASLNQNIRQAEAKAEIMMSRKDPYNNSMIKDVHQDWYFTDVDTHSPYPDGKLPSARQDARRSFRDNELKPSMSEVERSEETISALKGHLPHYLTDSGSVLSASVEVNDRLVSCVPGERSRSMQEKQKASTEDTPRLWHSAITTRANNEAAKASTEDSPRSWHSAKTRTSSEVSATTRPKEELCWQPLTTAALLEHTKVTSIPIKGMGCLAHGQYSMWKPDKIQTSE